MQNNLNKEQLKNIEAMLTMKKNILQSCVSDYDFQLKEVAKAIAELEKPTESEKA